MKRGILIVFIIALIVILTVILLFEEGIMKKRVAYNHDESMIGKQFEDVQSEWKYIDKAIEDDFRLLGHCFSLWRKGSKSLVAVFMDQKISDYLIYDSSNGEWIGTVADSLTTKKVLSEIAMKHYPPTVCDVGSGTTINAVFTCDGHIVTWTESNETLIFDALTLKQTNIFLLYRLMHGILF